MIISFRATGEGHISSIVFHTGVIDRNGALSFEQTGHYVDEPEVVKRHTYDKALIETKLREMGVEGEIVRAVMQPLKETFIYGELLGSALEVLARPSLSEEERRDVDHIVWVADSHYRIEFSRDTHISERVIFPPYLIRNEEALRMHVSYVLPMMTERLSTMLPIPLTTDIRFSRR